MIADENLQVDEEEIPGFSCYRTPKISIEKSKSLIMSSKKFQVKIFWIPGQMNVQW